MDLTEKRKNFLPAENRRTFLCSPASSLVIVATAISHIAQVV